MNAEQQQTPEQTETQQPTQGQPEDKGSGCGCDLEEIEQLTCQAKRFEQQAKVMNERAGDLQTYRQQYGAARQKYADARAEVLSGINAIDTILENTWEQLRCRLSDSQKSCMKKASDQVFKDITECSDPPGCHSPCDNTDAGDPEKETDIDKLAAEIARRRSNLTDSAEYFKALIAEPENVRARIAKLKADAELLSQDVGTGAGPEKIPELYARWLILKWWTKLERIGHGFTEVSEYLDCLCQVLKCLVSGWTTVAILEGRKAQLVCFAEGKATACTQKKEDTLHVIIDLYSKCCRKNETSPEGTGGKAEGSPTQQTPEAPEQGGCEKSSDTGA